MADQLPENVLHWYSNNADCDHPRVTAIPIGCVYNIEREQIMLDVLSQFHQRNKLCYMNFTRQMPRDPNPREGIYEMFGNRSWITVKGGDTLASVPAAEFYIDLATHKFCISPPGAGPDCHRHWEALAFGCVPIVLKSQAMQVLASFPHVAVDSWDQVTRELLESYVAPEGDYTERLDLRYWKEMICS